MHRVIRPARGIGALPFNAVASSISKTWLRALGTKPPGRDPLDVIRKECLARNLCDEHGYRRPGVHWVFSIAITPDDISQVCIATGSPQRA